MLQGRLSFRTTARPAAGIATKFTDEELAARRAAWTPLPPRYMRGYGYMFSRHVRQANDGCDFDFLQTDFGDAVGEPSIY